MTTRTRRSCLAVPGSSQKFIDKARTLPVDQVFLDLEDACAPLAKPGARKTIVEALNEGGWGDRLRVVRVNDWTTEWTYRDVTEVVEGAGAHLDAIMLPKVQTPEQIVALDLLMTQVEKAMGYELGKIGIEAQIENALGLTNVNAIATASPRVETIIFGPADFMASINMKSLVVGEQPPGYDVGDAYHHILMSILMAARAHDKLAIDGPYLQIKDVDGFRRVAGRSAALGFDGKWVLHPGQIEAANEVFSPAQADYDHAENILDAYEWCTSEAGGKKGAAMLGDEMIDEASRKMALVIAGKGRAAGMQRTDRWTPPEGGGVMARLAQTAGLTEIQQEILATVKTFVDKEILPHATALEHADEYPQDIVDGMKEMGLFGLTIPEEHGGLGESLLTYALVVEQIARGWMSVSGVINTHFIVAYMITQHGTEEQKAKYLPQMALGRDPGVVLDVGARPGFGRRGDQDQGGAGRGRSSSSTARRCGSPTAARRT